MNEIHQSKAYYLKDGRNILLSISGHYGGAFMGRTLGAGVEGRIDIWNLDSHKVIKTLTPKSGDFYTVGLSPNKQFFAFSSLYSIESDRYSETAPSEVVLKSYLISLDSNKFLTMYYRSKPGISYDDFSEGDHIIKLAFTADSKKILTQNRTGTIHIRSVIDGKIIDALGQKVAWATALASDLNNRYYISTHQDSTLRLWTPGIPNIFKRMQLESPATTISISPDSIHFATAHTEGTVALWNIDSLATYAQMDSVFTPIVSSITENKTLCKGDTVKFQVAAQSNFGEELLYQWQKGGVVLIESDSVIGVHLSTLILKNIDKSDAGSYSVIVKSTKGNGVTSASTLISVPGKLIITQQPNIKTSNIGFIISVQVSDPTGVIYEWFKDGIKIPGAGASSYEFGTSNKEFGIYKVKISNICGEVLMSQELPFGVSDVTEKPFKTTILSAEPNPFKNSTTIRFSLEKPLKIKLVVTNILGREIAVLKDGFAESGGQQVVFKNENLPEGTYFVTLSGSGFLKTIPVQVTR